MLDVALLRCRAGDWEPLPWGFPKAWERSNTSPVRCVTASGNGPKSSLGLRPLIVGLKMVKNINVRVKGHNVWIN